MVRSYLDTTFDRFEELIDVVVVVFVRRKLRRNRQPYRGRHLEFNRRRTRRFTFVLRRGLEFWSRGHEHGSPDAVPVADELGIGQLEKVRYKGLGTSNDRDRSWCQLVVTYDTSEVDLANDRDLSRTTISRDCIKQWYRLTMVPFVAFHHWREVPLISPSRRASSIARKAGSMVEEEDIVKEETMGMKEDIRQRRWIL